LPSRSTSSRSAWGSVGSGIVATLPKIAGVRTPATGVGFAIDS
jgi:hypothetical protein